MKKIHDLRDAEKHDAEVAAVVAASRIFTTAQRLYDDTPC